MKIYAVKKQAEEINVPGNETKQQTTLLYRAVPQGTTE
jgi:hypothetical protein